MGESGAGAERLLCSSYRGEVRRRASADRRRIKVEAATYYVSLGSRSVLPLTSSPVRHAYEPVPCIIVSFLWPMHVSHLQYHPEHTYGIHAPNHRTCKKKHRLETDYFHKLAMLIPSRRICCVGESHLAFHPPGALLCIFFDLLFLHLIV